MMSRGRSKPLIIATFLPLLGLLSIVAVQHLRGTGYLPAFVIAWSLMMAGLLVYVISQTLQARRARPSRRNVSESL